MRRPPVLLTLLLCGAMASPALAGGPGQWDRVTTPQGVNIDQPGLERTADGVLHVAWRTHSPSSEDLFHSPIAPTGGLGATSPIVQGWAGISDPALVTGTDGALLNAFFGGIRTTNAGETNSNLSWATSASGGGSWTLMPPDRARLGAAYASPMSATRFGNVLWQAWGGTGAGAFAHRGVDPNVPIIDLQGSIGGGCCGYDANIVADPVSNTVVAAWYSNSTGSPGVWAQAFAGASGAPLGQPVRMPGTIVDFQGSTEAPDLGDRTPIVANAKGGFYLAYPGGYPGRDRVLVWHLGPAASVFVGSKLSDVRGTALGAMADGRLWVAWSQSVGGARRIVGRRSNASVTKWGQAVAVKPPPGTSTLWALYGDANPSGVFDVLAHVDTPGSTATWHSQLLPGLTLLAPGKIGRHHKTKASFSVTDAGDPVAGATVKVAGKTGTTGSDGQVKLTIGPFGKKVKQVTAKATRSGYASRSRKIKVA